MNLVIYQKRIELFSIDTFFLSSLDIYLDFEDKKNTYSAREVAASAMSPNWTTTDWVKDFGPLFDKFWYLNMFSMNRTMTNEG